MKKYRRLIALFTVLTFLSVSLYGCGNTPETTAAVSAEEPVALGTPAATPEVTPEIDKKEDQSLEDVLNDILDRRDAKNAAPTPAPEPVPDDPFQDTALDAISTALDLCAAGAKDADALSEYSYRLADFYSTGQENDLTVEDYLLENMSRLESIKASKESVSALLTDLKASYPESDTGIEIKKQLVGILGEMDQSFGQMLDLARFYDDQDAIFQEYMGFDMTYETEEEMLTYIENYYTALLDLQGAYKKMKSPALISEIWNRNTDNIGITAESMYYYYIGFAAGSPLDNYVFVELSDYDDVLNSKYSTQMLSTMADCYGQTSLVFTDTYGEVLSSIRKNCRSWSGTAYSRISEPVFEYSIAKEIYPNTYTAMDSVINLTASTTAAKQDVIISAQVAGFTQEYRQKVTLTTRPQYLMIKPALLTELPNLSNNKKTQVNFTITDNDTGKVLVQESKTITLYSINDFFWENDEFGINSMFDLLGWLRPESDAVAAINRQAIAYLEATGMGDALVGYQYGFSYNEDLNTLIQVAAIQKAISDLGIRYTSDVYSYAAHQHILTPDQVLSRKTGLCIESTLLLASCLLSAGFHVMIVLIPGHAQVAVESWNGANGRTGEYYLVETTDLPYDGFYIQNGYYYFGDLFPNLMEPENSWWENYLAQQDGYVPYDGDVFVIDCDLRTVMNIQGLESFHEEFKLDPVSYPQGGSTGDVPVPVPSAGGNTGTGDDTGGSTPPAPDDDDYSKYFKTITVKGGGFSVDVPVDVTVDLADTDSLVYVPFVEGADIPSMVVAYFTDMNAKDFISVWIDILKEDASVSDPPSDYMEMDYAGKKLYGLEYATAQGTIESMYLYEQSADSFALFWVTYDANASDEDLNYLFTCLQAALSSFKVL